MQKIMLVIISTLFVVGIFFLSNSAYSENIDMVVNEICPTGCASSGYQWLEIYNKGDTAVDLENWKFWEGSTNHGLSIAPSSTQQDWLIEPGEYALIVQNDSYFFIDNPQVTSTVFDSSWGTLNKSGELIGLKDNNGDLVEEFTYTAIEDFSLERKDVSELATESSNWLEHPNSHMVGEVNYWTGHEVPANQLPTAVITANTEVNVNTEVSFAASGSSDPDGSIVSYDWDFGDGETATGVSLNHSYTTTGTFSVVLLVTDNVSATSSASLDITVSEETTVTSTVATLVINEFLSNPATGTEWIEIYNTSTSTIDLTGWTLSDGVGVIASPTSTVSGTGFVLIELSSAKLNNSGDIILLKDDSEAIIDQVCYGNWSEDCLGEAAAEPDKGNSLARSVDGQDTDVDIADFAETTTLTPLEANVITPPVAETPPPGGGGGGGSPTPAVSYEAGAILISELVSDPADGKEEFVELYNTTSGNISLAGWWLEDGNESQTDLSGSVAANGFYVIEEPKGNLNNSGDLVAIFSPDGKEIDRLTYGTWDDGNVNDNAPAAKDPLSLVRKVTGQDSDNDYYDFVLTSTITPGAPNVVSTVTVDGQIIEQLSGSTQVVINEVLPNPTGSDNRAEFIELKNLGNETIDLTDWQLSDATKRKYTITQGNLPPKGLLVFKRSQTAIALNNTGGEEVKLYDPNGSLVDTVKYTGSANEEQSYARKDDGSWVWTIELTPGEANIVKGKSAAPIIVIDTDTEVAQGESVIFDASDTTDPEGEAMTFVWNFGDGDEDTSDVVEHMFTEVGIYTVKLVVADSSGSEASKQVIITVKNRWDFVGGYLEEDNTGKIEISELVPNPEGSDTTEFIELVNRTEEAIDLSGLKLDDEEGGSWGYTIPLGTIIEPGQYLVWGKQDTGIALNNTSDAVRLLYPDGTVLKEVRYDDVPEGAAYVQDENDNWVWTGSLTPGEANVIIAVKEKVSARTVSRSKYVKPVIHTTLERLRDEDIGDKVIVTGVVAVEPGVLASQYLYIVGSPGVQVYMYKKDWPILRVGDRVEIKGEISQAYGNTRIKLKEKSDIQIIDHPGDPQPKVAEIAEIGEPLEGYLLTVHGEITERKGSYMYVDDGTEEVKVYFKRGTGINKKIYKVGDLVEVTGLVYQSRSEFRLLPRSVEDITKTGVAENYVMLMENTEEEGKKEVAEKYLTATAGGLTSILVGLFAKARGSFALTFLKRIGVFAIGIFKRRV